MSTISDTMNVFTAGNGHALQTLAFALDEAKRLQHPAIQPQHLLLGLLRLERGTVVSVLNAMKVNLEGARIKVEELGPKAEGEKAPGSMIPYSPRSKLGLGLAAKEAVRLHHRRIGPEHLLLGLLMADEGSASQVLKSFGVMPEILREEILRQLGGVRP